MSETFNPYTPPTAVVDDVIEGLDAQAEATRKDHIKHEASIKAIGFLYYLSGFGFGAVSLLGIFGLSGNADADGLGKLFLFGFLVLGVIYLAVGRGLRTLRPWVRIPTCLLSFSVCSVSRSGR